MAISCLLSSKPPRRISEAPSARNLKPRRVSAIRRWPPGCGRFPPPSCSSPVSLTTTPATATSTNTVISDSNSVPDHANQPHHSPPPPPPPHPEGKIDNLLAAIRESLGNYLKKEAVEGPNGNLLVEREEEEKDKKGDLSIKRWMNSKAYPPPKRRAVSAIRRYPLGCGRNPDFCLGLIDRPQESDTSSHKINHQEIENENENQNKHDKMCREIGVLVEEEDVA